MDFYKKHNNPNPTLTANIFSKLWFIWLFPLLWYGKKHEIEEKDLYNTLPQDCSGPLGDKLEKLWNKEIEKAKNEKRKPNFFNVITKAFFWPSLKAAQYMGFGVVILRPFLPTLIACYIEYFEVGSTTTKTTAYLYATLVIVGMYLYTMLGQHSMLKMLLVGMQARVACSALIYKKITKLSCSSISQTKEGFVINLLLDDCLRFELWFTALQQTWMVLFQVPIVIYLVWRRVGIACAVGIIFLFLQTLPIQVYFGKIIFKLRKKAAPRTDRRILLIKEVISGIHVIKMYAWEKPIDKIVSFARKYEVDVLTKMAYLKSMNWAAYALTERTTLFIILMSYVLLESRLTSTIDTYSIVQHLGGLQTLIGLFLMRSVSSFSETKVAAKRIEKFLLLDEVSQVAKPLSNTNDDNISISIEEVSASLTIESKAVLNNINIQLSKTKLYVLLGPTGSGKRSFLRLILEELRPSSGKVLLNGKVSYSSVKPWLFAGSIRDNILFGEVYDEVRYMNITRACCLMSDFAQLPHGDKTVLTEGGTVLSGGQRARINLARAIYREADIYILDDPLSAVDINVGKELMEGCINGLLKDKTRILVTHNLHYLNKEDNVILFSKGSITYQGTFGDLPNDSVHYQDLSTCTALENSSKKEKSSAKIDDKINTQEKNQNLIHETNDDNEDTDETAELMAKGKIEKSLLWKYYKFGASYWRIIIVFMSFVITQFIFTFTDYWVAYIIKLSESNRNEFDGYVSYNTTSNTDTNVKSTNFYLNIYGCLIAAGVIFTIARNLLYFKTCMNVNKNIHNNMVFTLLRAPLRFFHLNTTGRIINRLSKDVGVIDDSFPSMSFLTYQLIFGAIGVMIQVFIINWWIIFPTVILIYLYWLLQELHSPTVRCIKRLEGTSKSPVLSHVSSTFSGLLTIRSCHAEPIMCKVFDSRQDVNTSANYLVLISLTTFGIWIDLVSIILTTMVIYSFVAIDNSEFASNVGLAVTQIFIILTNVQFIMRNLAELDQQLISVERIIQFTKLNQETSFVSESNETPPNSWPDNGRIEFNNLYLRYSETAEPVLKNLSFTIQPKEKVGIVGRTGAGKSSLTAALFRLAKIDGSLYIDKINVTEIGLNDIRAKISILPQESFFMSTSLRENVDPNHDFDDATIWSALNDVKLNKLFISLDESLDQKNLNIGQLQLLSIARAILKNNKILVLDEATANVDKKTDTLIQKIVRDKFKNCTVLTIAHRLSTIMDSDKVLVMEAGEIVEYDHPHILLQKTDGYFLKMAQQGGEEVCNSFKEKARNAWKQKQDNLK